MLTERHRLKMLGFIFGDLILFQIALIIALWIRYARFDVQDWSLHALPFFLLSIIWVIVLYIAGLYDFLLIREPIALFRKYLEGMLANAFVGFAFFYLFPFFGIAPRRILVIEFVLFLLLGYLWRLIIGHYIKTSSQPTKAIYVGPAREAQPLARLLTESPLGIQLTDVFVTEGHANPLDGFHVHTEIERLPQLITEQATRVLILGATPEDNEILKQAIYQSMYHPITILDRAEIEEAATGRIPLNHVNESWFLHHLKETEKAWYEAVKRGIDILLSIPFGLLTLFTLPFIAIAIKIASPDGHIFIRQTRVGKFGKPFTLIKYRTMHPLGAEKTGEANGPQFTANAKTDPRIYPLGRILRQLRIDELPQIWNVVTGDLSFIGPRPERPEFTEPLEVQMPFYKLRHLTRPGLTGWAQVSYLIPTAVLEDNLRKLQYDLFYIKHRSLFLDALILLKTIGVVIRRQGT